MLVQVLQALSPGRCSGAALGEPPGPAAWWRCTAYIWLHSDTQVPPFRGTILYDRFNGFLNHLTHLREVNSTVACQWHVTAVQMRLSAVVYQEPNLDQFLYSALSAVIFLVREALRVRRR